MTSEPIRHAETDIPRSRLDRDAVKIVRQLTEAGHESYLVGGCVRDLLLGLEPKDFDISTKATPRQIKRLFRNSRIIGRRFKLAHIYFGKKIIEVSTFRRRPEGSDENKADDEDLLIVRDNEYGTAREDVLRRDFTINALMYDVSKHEVIDYVGGFQDVQMRLLRPIGEAKIRFAEDPVRMLRAIKFVARANLQFAEGVEDALREKASLVSRSAPPRVLEEIYKLMCCGSAGRGLALFADLHLFEALFPEIATDWNATPGAFAELGSALDLIDQGRRDCSNGFLLSALLLASWHAATETQKGDPTAIATKLITPIALRMSMPRRDVGVMKQILVAQLKFARPRHSRRLRISEFLSRPTTREAITFLHLACRSGLTDPEVHARWVERLAHQDRHHSPHQNGSPDRESRNRNPRQRQRQRRGSRDQRQPTQHSSPPDAPPQAETPAEKEAAAPRSFRGMVRGLIQKVWKPKEDSQPSTDSSRPTQEQKAQSAHPASSQRSQRRRRPRRRPRRRQQGAASVTTGDSETQDNQKESENRDPQRKQRRRRRPRRRSRDSRTQRSPDSRDGQDVPSSEHGDTDQKKSPRQSGRRRRKSGHESQQKNDSASTPEPSHQRPEDIEDVFDW